ncbi:zinc finger protein 34-like isoform X1 [Melanaphis sacchari]|uniref:Zinc finger protein 345 n=1 Tax=Melanaphis sacchari TaxID=742174 RepID=A0A2H8TWI7_9HEMI|nr:zinc finger protein 34-like isoform X1 [Melanaphis sacchari]
MEEREDVTDKTKNNLDNCRLCFSTTNVTVNIGQNIDKNTTIIEKIHYCTSLIVKVGDNFPQNICTTCAETLDLIYNFKSKAIACDLELSKNVHKEIHYTYIQLTDDPLNITYKLHLEEQDSSTDLIDSCLYNIVDGDELKIEPVNVTTMHVDENASTNKEITNDDSKKSDVIANKLNGSLNSCQDSTINNQKKSTIVDLKRSPDKSIFNKEKRKLKKVKTENEVDSEKRLVIVKNGKVVYICGECGFEAESMVFLISHQTRFHSDVSSFKCSECPTYYKTPGQLKRHISMHHNVTHVCKYCEKRFSNKQTLDRHTSCHHNETPLEFQCVKCNAYFDTMDKMEDHLVVHYTSPSSTFSCNHCDRMFTTYAAKNKHIDLEHMIEIECGICHVVLPTKEAMDKHNNSVHQPKKKENKMYECTTCGKYFSGIKEVLNHRETHLS